MLHDMPQGQIMKIVRFFQRFGSPESELVLSGGEPLLYLGLEQVLTTIREAGIDYVTITTNGSLLAEKHLRLIEQLAFKSFCLSVSIDSIDPLTHDQFRMHEGAFKKADAALRLASKSNIPGLVVCVRSTIPPSRIGEINRLVDYARAMGCARIGFSAIHPVGRAKHRNDLLMMAEQKTAFLEEIYRIHGLYSDINVGTNDPLKCLFRNNSQATNCTDLVFNGCGAGVTTFNVDSDGNMTPCALLDIPIMNIFSMSVEEMIERYQESPIVRQLLARNFKGKCGLCPMKYECGGCRARAYAESNDFLQSDPHCLI